MSNVKMSPTQHTSLRYHVANQPTVPQPTRCPGKNGHQECYEKFPTAGRQSRAGEKKEGASLNNFPMWLDFTTPTVGTGAEGRGSGGRLARFCFCWFLWHQKYFHIYRLMKIPSCGGDRRWLAMCQLLEMINTAHTWLKCRNLHNFSR